jgi:hypothetical protein
MNKFAVLDCAEVKVGSTDKDTMGASGPWAGAYRPPCCFRSTIPQASARSVRGPVTFTLIASTFDRRTFNGIEYLQTSGIRVRALRYVRRGRSMNVVPCTAADLNRTAQRASRVGPSDGRRLVAGGRLRPTRFTGTFVTSGRSTRVSSCGSLSRSASFGRVTGNGG